MREILFRGKCVDTGRWYEGQYIHLHKTTFWFKEDYDHHQDNDIHQIVFEEMTDFGLPNRHLRADVAPETVGQCTGLTDKNGNIIFEGDIVKFTDSPFGYSHTGSVCFHEGSFCIQYTYWNKERFHRIGKTETWQDMGASGTVTYEYEVIGNIHDNPELLEE